MNIEKIIKRKDKSRVKIGVTLHVDARGPIWSVWVAFCPPGKRKFIPVDLSNNYQWRGLNMADRAKATRTEQLKHVTEAEILAAKVELWESLKPAK